MLAVPKAYLMTLQCVELLCDDVRCLAQGTFECQDWGAQTQAVTRTVVTSYLSEQLSNKQRCCVSEPHSAVGAAQAAPEERQPRSRCRLVEPTAKQVHRFAITTSSGSATDRQACQLISSHGPRCMCMLTGQSHLSGHCAHAVFHAWVS